MKSTRTFLKRFLFLSAIGTALITTSASAYTGYTWDPQGTNSQNPYLGDLSGTWESASWATSSTEAPQAVPVVFVEGKAACFAYNTGTNTPPFTITMNSNHSVAGVFIGALNPNACKVTIVGSGIMSMPSGLQGFDLFNATDGSLAYLTISNVLAGPGTLTAENNGQLFLNASNTFTGGTSLGFSGGSFSGIVNFNNPKSFGTGNIIVSNSSGALAIEVTNAMTITNAFVGAPSAAKINIVGNSAGLTFSGPWALAGTTSIGTSSTAANLLILSGVISGTGPILKFNTGIMVLSGSNTYTGGTILSNAGPLVVTQDANLGDAGGAITMAAGSVLTASNSFELLSSRIVQLNGQATINVAAGKLLTNSALMGGIGGLTKAGTGTLILNEQAEQYGSNTTVSAGTLQFTANASVLSTNISIAASGTLDISRIGGYDFDAAPGGANQVLNAAGTGVSSTTAATLAISSLAGATLGSSTTLKLTWKPTTFTGDLTHPAMVVTGGPLTLDGGLITITNTPTNALGGGTYTILSSGTGGSLLINSMPTITLLKTNFVTGATYSLQFVTNSLQLVVVTPVVPTNTVTAITAISGGTNVNISFLGVPSTSYTVQATTNLTPPINWSNVFTTTSGTNGVFNYNDTNSASYPTRFYRAFSVH